MALSAKVIRTQLALLPPLLEGCSLKTIRASQNKIGQQMETRHRDSVLVKEHVFSRFAMGSMTLVTEFLMDLTFGFPKFLGWSLYPLVTLVLLGGVLIFIAICRSAREVMERKLFI